MTVITDIEGIGPAFAEKLAVGGITTCEALLEKGATKDGREELAAATDLTEDQVHKWVKQADLTRVKGVGSEYAELLVVAGVDSVPELAQRNAENLAATMAELNEEKSLVRVVPAVSRVVEWVANAKDLPRVITH